MQEQKTAEGRRRMSIWDITLMGMMVAVMEVSKLALSFLPNIELVSFWIILFTLFFRWRVLFAIPAFVLIEGLLYGINLWWISFLYAWPLLALAAWLFRRQKSALFWSILSGTFGLLFGMFFAIPYVVIGAAGNGLRSGLYAGFTWWVAGIPYDITHGIGNFVLMLVLYKPVLAAMKRLPGMR